MWSHHTAVNLLAIDFGCLDPKWSVIIAYLASSSMTACLVSSFAERIQDWPNVEESENHAMELSQLMSSFESTY